MPQHEIVVGNIGCVHMGVFDRDAERTFDRYVELSKAGEGRAGDEPVSWFIDGELHKDYVPPEANHAGNKDD